MTAQTGRKPRSSSEVKSRLLARGFDVLFYLANQVEGARLKDLCESTTLSRATALRILRTLMDIDVVTYNVKTRTYNLGPAIFRLNIMARSTYDVVRLGRASMNALRDETGETVCLFQIHGDERVCVASAVTTKDLGLFVEVGQRRPLMAGAAGRVLVAFLPEEQRRAILKKFSLTEQRNLRRDFTKIMNTRIMVTRGEMVEGATGIATPIFDSDGRVETALAVVGPTVRLSDPAVDVLAPIILQAAGHISRLRGWSEEEKDWLERAEI